MHFELTAIQTISVQVNIPAESGEMGVLANHVPSIEQLRPGLVEVIEESGGSKQFFCTCILEDEWPGICSRMDWHNFQRLEMKWKRKTS